MLCATVPMKGKAPPPLKRLVATKIAKPVKLDGKLDEPAWKTAASTAFCGHHEWQSRPR